jgi:hypothetical protein
MLKIKKITIENFRGIKPPLTIDFVKGGSYSSVLIYGRNGTGKSSIVDAWEWLNKFEIVGLKKEGVSAKDYPHKSSNGENSYTLVEFNHSTINSVKVTFDPSRITKPNTSGEYSQFKSRSKYPNFLRYSDLQDFVYKTKTEKYKYIAKFFGLEHFIETQDDLQAYINKLEVKLGDYQNNLTRSSSTIQEIIGGSTIDDATVVSFFNTVCAKHTIATITQFKEAKKVKDALEKLVDENPKTKELTEWKAFQTKLNQFYPIQALKTELEDLEKRFTDLKKDEDNITKLILAGLYQTSIEVIPQLEDKTKCPICDRFFEGDLLSHIIEKHTALDELNKKKIAFDTQKAALEEKFDTLSQKVAAIQSETSTTVLATFKEFFDDLSVINTSIPTAAALLKKQVVELSTLNLSIQEFIEKIDSISASEAAYQKIVSDKTTDLEADVARKSLAEDYGNILKLKDTYPDYLVYSKQVDYLIMLKSNFDTLFSQLTSFIQNKIQTTFTSISADVVDYFDILEGSNPFIKNPQIKFITGKNKAVELEIEFMSEKITPAFKFLSESQVNSFGLAIFLAAVKHFNDQFKFIILDDIVHSFDSFKRSRVSQLLASKLDDFQVLILTHDQIFFDTLQRDFPSWNRYKFTSWDFATGPRYRLAKNYSEEISEFLQEDNPIAAGQSLGRYLEWTFGVLNENLKTPIPYKLENVYTLSEFFEPLKARFKKKLKQSGKQHKLIHFFDELETGTIFRNYCVHWKNEASPYTTFEIEAIFNKWLDIEQMIYCNSCKSFVKYESIDNTNYVRCNCGTINLKDAQHYFEQEKSTAANCP